MYRDPDFWQKVIGPFGIFVTTFFGAAIGRASHWVIIKKRKPNTREMLVEPIIILFMGIVAGGVLVQSGIQEPMVISGASALFAHYGPKSIDWILKYGASKLGIEIDGAICDTSLRGDQNDKSKN